MERKEVPNLRGKVAVVTGASSGIGAAIAKELAADGASVVVNYLSNEVRAREIVNDIRQTGGEAVAFPGDVSSQTDIGALFSNVGKVFGKIDILINNAGVAHRALLQDITVDAMQSVFSVNVAGVILATKAAVELFSTEGGSIINVSSISVTAAYPGSVVLAASKGAVEALTRVLANELGPRNIRVNAVSPGFTVTEGARFAVPDVAERIRQVTERTPLGRVGQAVDIAKIVSFMASDDASWITGTVLAAAGGLR